MMFQVNFDPEMLRQIIREELTTILEGQANQCYALPPLLTRSELKHLLRIGDTKAAELLGKRTVITITTAILTRGLHWAYVQRLNI